MGPQNNQFVKNTLVGLFEGKTSRNYSNEFNKHGIRKIDPEEHFESKWTEKGDGFRCVKGISDDSVGVSSPGLISKLESDTSIPMASGFILSGNDCELKYSYEDNTLTLLTRDSVSSIKISDGVDEMESMMSERFTSQLVLKIQELINDYSSLRNELENEFKEKSQSEEILRTLSSIMKAATTTQSSEQLHGLMSQLETYDDYFESLIDEEELPELNYDED